MELSAKELVFRAADLISFECPPNISMVRAATGVTEADADRYLREWEVEQLTAGGRATATAAELPSAPTGPTVVSDPEDSERAIEGHEAREIVRAREKNDLVGKIIADLKRVSAEMDAAVATFAARFSHLENQLSAIERQLERAGVAESNPAGQALQGDR